MSYDPEQSHESFGAPGWPRPRAVADLGEDEQGCPRSAQLPAPWLNGSWPAEGEWLSFRDDCARAHAERLCLVCGCALGNTIVLGAFTGRRLTSGPGMHPRCALLATRTCPHFENRETQQDAAGNPLPMAWAYYGTGVGYETEDPAEPYTEDNPVDSSAIALSGEALRALAKEDPWGGAPRPVAYEQGSCPLPHPA